MYIGQDDEEPVHLKCQTSHFKQFQLIRICPESNSVALVLRDPEVFSFQKYANSLTEGTFYQFTLVYHNVQMESDEEE